MVCAKSGTHHARFLSQLSPATILLRNDCLMGPGASTFLPYRRLHREQTKGREPGTEHAALLANVAFQPTGICEEISLR